MPQEEKKGRFKALFKQSLDDEQTSLKPLPALGNKVIIKGDMNHFAEGSTQLKVMVVAPPAVVLISKAQKADLVARRNQWVDLHNTVKARQMTRADARKAINARAKVSAHRLIPAARHDDLVRWLDTRIKALRITEQLLVERNRRDLTRLKPQVEALRHANPTDDLTPPQKGIPLPPAILLKLPNRGHSVPTKTSTPGIPAGNSGILCQTQIGLSFPPPTPQTLAPQAFQPGHARKPTLTPCANCPPPSQQQRQEAFVEGAA